MSFSQAIQKIVDGKCVARYEWASVEPESYGVLKDNRLKIYRAGTFHIWEVSEGDMFANDWIVVDARPN